MFFLGEHLFYFIIFGIISSMYHIESFRIAKKNIKNNQVIFIQNFSNVISYLHRERGCTAAVPKTRILRSKLVTLWNLTVQKQLLFYPASIQKFFFLPFFISIILIEFQYYFSSEILNLFGLSLVFRLGRRCLKNKQKILFKKRLVNVNASAIKINKKSIYTYTVTIYKKILYISCKNSLQKKN